MTSKVIITVNSYTCQIKDPVCKFFNAVAALVELSNEIGHTGNEKQGEKSIYGHPFNAFIVQPPTIQLRKSL